MGNYEIEIKIPVENRQDILERLVEMGFQRKKEIRESDMYYNSEYHDVRKRDEALRIRESTDLMTGERKVQLNFKGPKIDQISMSRQEYETGVEDAENMAHILEALGFRKVAGVEKNRIYLKRREMTACADRVKGLGDFLELEVMVPEDGMRESCLLKMEEVLKILGHSMKDTIRHSYLSMLMQKDTLGD